MKIKIKQVRSVIGRPEKQRRTMSALGLGKINREVVKQATPQLVGMIKQVSHLVSISIVSE